MLLINQGWIIRRSWFLLIVLLAIGEVIMWGCKRDTTITVGPARTINDVIAEKDQFTLLKAAVTRAGLNTSLTQGGPLGGPSNLVLFAPTNDALRAAGFVDVAAINAASVAMLNTILLYHLVSGKAKDLSIQTSGVYSTGQQKPYPTLFAGDAPLFVTKTNSASLSVNGARILDGGAYSLADNGEIYAIDQVLFPPAGDILRAVQADTSLSLFATAALRGGTLVTGALSNTATTLTVFAPTNAAFRAAGFPNAAAVNAAPEATLTALLANHVVANIRTFTPIITSGSVTTFGGGVVRTAVGVNGSVSLVSQGNGTNVSNVLSNTVVNGTLVRNRDINTTNGVIHKIDRVLLP